MRLIDANALMQEIVQYDNENIQSPNRGTIVDVIDTISEMLTEQPTAYDIDKVVEQLEEKAKAVYNEIEGDYINYVALENAIEIVKGGADNA